MSINVEIIGGSLMVQHYVETLGCKDQLILDPESDVFTPNGRTRIHRAFCHSRCVARRNAA